MRLAPEVTTRLLAGPLPESEVLVDGNPGRARVAGAVLEAAVRWDDFYLLFLTDDVPAEDNREPGDLVRSTVSGPRSLNPTRSPGSVEGMVSRSGYGALSRPLRTARAPSWSATISRSG